jgi:hypothetical protein
VVTPSGVIQLKIQEFVTHVLLIAKHAQDLKLPPAQNVTQVSGKPLRPRSAQLVLLDA